MTKYCFVCLNNDGLDGLRRPRHILMQRLSRLGHRVLFVSSPVSHWSKRLPQPELKMGGVKRLAKRFYWYQPPVFLPASCGTLRDRAALALRSRLLGGVIALLSKRPRIFFVAVPDRDYLRVLKYHRDAFVIYNVHDRFVDEQGRWPDDHEEMVRRADILLCGSRFLVEEMRAHQEKPVYFFPPGIDLDVFPQHPVFKPRASRPRAVVGCIGSLGEQMDWQMLRALAHSEQQLDFRFIGTVPEITRQAPCFQEFIRLPNVCFQGMVPHSTIPSIINGFDLCIMPYKVNAYTAGVNPLKLIEYLALGKPVVSSPIPAVEYGDLVYTASGVEAWRSAFRQALGEDTEERFRARVEFAHGQEYDRRISQLLTLIGSDDRDVGSAQT